MAKYIYSDSALSDDDCSLLLSGLDAFKVEIQNYIKKYPKDKETRKNGIAKIDDINSAKNKIERQNSDFSLSEAVVMYLGLEQLNSDSEQTNSLKSTFKTFFDSAGIDLNAVFSVPDDYPDPIK